MTCGVWRVACGVWRVASVFSSYILRLLFSTNFSLHILSAFPSYGYTGNKGTIATPNIKQLAAEGLVFQNWYGLQQLEI